MRKAERFVPPASLAFIGQVTKQIAVKWPISSEGKIVYSGEGGLRAFHQRDQKTSSLATFSSQSF